MQNEQRRHTARAASEGAATAASAAAAATATTAAATTATTADQGVKVGLRGDVAVAGSTRNRVLEIPL